MYFKYDMKIGFIRDFYKFFLLIIITLAGCIWFDGILSSNIHANVINDNHSIINIYAFFFKGCAPRNANEQKVFELPIIWLLFQSYLMFILGRYPYSEMNDNHGAFVLIKGKNKKCWYLSKCIWNGITVLSYYICSYGTIFIYGIIKGYSINCKFATPIDDIALKSFVVPIEKIHTPGIIALFLIPIIASFSLANIQLMVSTVASSVIGFVSSIIILVSSAFYMNVLLIGNMTMWGRFEYFLDGNIKPVIGIVIAFSFGLISVIIGMNIFLHKDILIKDN